MAETERGSVSCGSCRYFQPVKDLDQADGECRWRPPVLQVQGMHHPLWRWAEVKARAWCGQWGQLRAEENLRQAERLKRMLNEPDL